MTNYEKKTKRIQKNYPWHLKTCVCGHLITWIPRKGYCCMCVNPKPR
jgi:hypothetical protein